MMKRRLPSRPRILFRRANYRILRISEVARLACARGTNRPEPPVGPRQPESDSLKGGRLLRSDPRLPADCGGGLDVRFDSRGLAGRFLTSGFDRRGSESQPDGGTHLPVRSVSAVDVANGSSARESNRISSSIS